MGTKCHMIPYTTIPSVEETASSKQSFICVFLTLLLISVCVCRKVCAKLSNCLSKIGAEMETIVKETTMKDVECGRGDRDGRESDNHQLSNQHTGSCSSRTRSPKSRTFILGFLIIAVGLACAVAFSVVSIRSDRSDQQLRFEKQADSVAQSIHSRWEDYEMVAMWINQAFRDKEDTSSFSQARKEFEVLYKYVLANGLEVQSISYVPNVTNSVREALEEESREYYNRTLPGYSYRGFTGLGPGYKSVEVRPTQPFYFPEILLQPLRGNEFFIDFDMYSSLFSSLIDQALAMETPLTSIPLVTSDTDVYSVLLMHPGIELDTAASTGLGTVTIVFQHLVQNISVAQPEEVTVYMYNKMRENLDWRYFGAADLCPTDGGLVSANSIKFSHYDELLNNMDSSNKVRERVIPFGGAQWKTVVIGKAKHYGPDIFNAFLGGALIFVACVAIATWFVSSNIRDVQLQALKREADEELAALTIRNATEAARAERDLNEYLSHEVRNPLSAALSACSFIETSIQQNFRSRAHAKVAAEEEENHTLSEDVQVVRSSLEYINDLLRSMLEFSKIGSRQLKLSMEPADLNADVFEPVRTMIQHRDNPYDIIIEAPVSIFIETDRMRLKQVVLNLAGNARKFVQTGFIRIRAQVVNGNVQIEVQDSGPGIPESKRNSLFSRFQDSLDILQQGTGMGLSLCKRLVELMGGELFLDETYHSGLNGNPGACFVIKTNKAPVEVNNSVDVIVSSSTSGDIDFGSEVPDNLSVLVVDDDPILRKMLVRSLKRVSNTIEIRQASNGETAISLVASHQFDLIFIDQYMASVERQLLGTETVAAMRANGVTCRICGLSANCMEEAFLDAGADHFLVKPFSTEINSLRKDVLAALGRL